MNVDAETLITIKVVGADSEGGHIRIDEFLEALTHLLTSLNGIDRLVGQTGRPTLYYRVLEARQHGALEITLQPALRSSVARPDADHIRLRHHRFFDELQAIRNSRPVSPEVDDQLLEHLRDITPSAETSFKAVTISNYTASVDLDKTFEENIRKLLDEEDASYGHVEGNLDTVNMHGFNRRFWIYPKVGPQRIRCDFLPGTSEQIREALGQSVRVEGFKYFRPQSPYPYRVAVRDFEIIGDTQKVRLADLRGAAKGTVADSVQFVRAMRDEWD